MVSFGSKAGKNYKVDQTKGAQWFTTLKSGKDMRVRFLEEPWDWFKFNEHFHPTLKYFPCTGETDCFGCNHESDQVRRRSTKYGVNALDTASGTVLPLKLSYDLSQRLFARADRSGGTLTDRDYTLWREGSGLDTKYDYDAGDRSNVDINRYRSQFHDTEQLVVQAFEDSFGKPNPEDQYKKPEVRETKKDPWVAPQEDDGKSPF